MENESKFSCFREIFDEIGKWDLRDLKGARDHLGQSFKEAGNYVLWAYCGLECLEDKFSEDKDRYYFESKLHPEICFKFHEGNLFGKYDRVGAYRKTPAGMEPIKIPDGSIFSIDKSSIINSIVDRINELENK